MKGKINEFPDVDTSRYSIDENGNVLRDKRTTDNDCKKVLFAKINFITLGCESDYKYRFKNKKIHRLYLRIERCLYKLAILMKKELEE